MDETGVVMEMSFQAQSIEGRGRGFASFNSFGEA